MDELRKADDLLYLIALEMADEVQLRTLICAECVFLQQLLNAVFAAGREPCGYRLAHAGGVVHLGRADEQDIPLVPPGVFRRARYIFSHLGEIFRYRHCVSTFPSYMSVPERMTRSPSLRASPLPLGSARQQSLSLYISSAPRRSTTPAQRT